MSTDKESAAVHKQDAITGVPLTCAACGTTRADYVVARSDKDEGLRQGDFMGCQNCGVVNRFDKGRFRVIAETDLAGFPAYIHTDMLRTIIVQWNLLYANKT